jgi:hypothetical protein
MLVWVRVFGILIVIVRRETDTNTSCPDGGSDCADDFEREAAAVRDGPAVCVRTGVDVIVEELLQEVAICSVLESI